jgi:hypothetical protein
MNAACWLIICALSINMASTTYLIWRRSLVCPIGFSSDLHPYDSMSPSAMTELAVART